jgi:hypothetical protein
VIWLDVVWKISAVLGGTLALFTFWRTAKVRRAEWLSNLHAKFFEAPGYKRIRRVLDSSDSAPDLSKLRDDIAADAASELAEEFVDYLNFFEFVASLRKLRQLKLHEITMLFDYYLRLLSKHDFVRTYIRKNGFEQLELLFEECVKAKTK